MISEEALLNKLKDWDLLEISIKEIKEKINENTYQTTAKYSQSPLGGGSGNSGKLENYCIRMMKSKENLERLLKFRDSVIRAYCNAGLTGLEKKIIIFTCARRSLLDIARKHNVSQAGIYRARNRAIKKMCKYINQTTK